MLATGSPSRDLVRECEPEADAEEVVGLSTVGSGSRKIDENWEWG